MFRVGLKYCGGCNPMFDRIAAVQKIREELAGEAELIPLSEGDSEVVLAVMGCGAACADVEGIDESRLVVIVSEKDIEAVVEEIKRKHKDLNK